MTFYTSTKSQETSYLAPITRAVFDPGTLTGSYQALNGTGTTDDVKILKIYNGGSVGIDISFDGVTDHDFWPAGATLIIDSQANHIAVSISGSGVKYIPKGQIIYGKSSTVSAQLIISGFR